jgi:hypothetical protein
MYSRGLAATKMELAVIAVREGKLSIRQAAEKYGIPPTSVFLQSLLNPVGRESHGVLFCTTNKPRLHSLLELQRLTYLSESS